ncbi:Transcription factor, GATA [Artemisia annua]|uniref:Transcription factor, GATA n=1 Tax=Artemisia annua TaxID=35608 RepID=A0A2U1P7P9_ARTAN|nr:Transcription factor, GATA [Artemisia annua]
MDCFTNEYYSKNDKHNDIMTNNNNNEFMLDDLIVDFPNEDDIVLNDAFFHNVVGHEGDLSNVSVGDSCNSSVSGSDQPPFSDVELCLPYDELIEFEWLSGFKHEAFSIDDVQNQPLVPIENKSLATDTSSSGTDVYSFQSKHEVTHRINSHIFHRNVAVPVKARSSRSRWFTYNMFALWVHSTPQWRTGPMGPKTLCNACGVRYKSGRLVPEYRPANSPTYVPAKHSNSHRKVMEIRRQKELRNVGSGLWK